MRFESVARTHAGCRRKVNEDSFLSRPEKGLWAVADGMGGHDAGDIASALVAMMLDESADQPPLADRELGLRAALDQANARLIAMSGDYGPGSTIGTTIVVLAADGGSFICLWAGDSRAYVVRNGKLMQVTHDHSLVQELVDAGEIRAADASRHPNANVITRAVGSSALLEIDRVAGPIASGDTFLIASDGLTRLASECELQSAVASQDLETAADRLLAMCLERGAPDNVTFVIVRACLD
jgi:serine/threonine protein phosphatase Stp1